MRALRVLGLAEDGVHVICEDQDSGDNFIIPADDRLRAAARGQLSRQRHVQQEMEPPMEPQLRPREIQMRVRAGASLDEVAELANCDPARIERYAYPVLMERSTVAGRARLARPVIGGSSGSQSVEAVVTETLTARSQATTMNWDAYREDGGTWILTLIWTAGHSENTARWAFHPGGAGGTVTAIDDAAAEIMDPAPRPLRTVREAPEEEIDPSPVNPLVIQSEPAEPAAEPASPPTAPQLDFPLPVAPRPVHSPSRTGATNKVAAALAHHAVTAPPSQSARDDQRTADLSSPSQSGQGQSGQGQSAAAVQPSTVRRTGTEHADGPPARGQRAPMPSWEDVLLGVRSSGQ